MKLHFLLIATATVATVLTAVAGPVQSRTPVPTFRLTTTDGKPFTTANLTARASVVLFLKHGCPHNPKAVADLNRLAAQLGPRVPVVAMVNLDTAKARGYRAELGLKLPVVADPSGKTIAAFGATHSLDLALVGAGGRGVARRWNGYNRTALAELVRMLPEQGGPRMTVDLSAYPSRLVSGCGF